MKKKIFNIVEAALLFLGVMILPFIKGLFPEPETAYAMLFTAGNAGIIFILKTVEIFVACDKKERKKEILPAVVLFLLTGFSLCYGIVLL